MLWADRFLLGPLIGQGGMGQIYRAHDQKDDRPVALKVLDARGRPQESAARFAHEAELLCSLQHPGLVRYLAHDIAPSGNPFFAMEWLDGEDLAKRLARAPLSLADALRLIDRVAEALAYLHERKVLHRDIKPSNLFLPQGDVNQVKILDLGIALHATRVTRITRSGVIVGTPEYLPPERARAKQELTPASDLFSLGCVLYECLAGDPPFAADHVAATLARILFEEPLSIESKRPGIPSPVAQIVHKLLAKTPQARYQSANQLRAALAGLGAMPLMFGAPKHTTEANAPEVFGRGELSLVSVILAAPLEPADEESGSPEMASGRLLESERSDLIDSLTQLGISAQFLAGPVLLATVSGSESATDLARLAARGALLIRSYWPEAKVVMATGRGRVEGETMLGDVVAQAGALLDSEAAPGADPHKEALGVRLDTLSAKLLEGRFTLHTPEDGTPRLYGAREAEETGQLLGMPTQFVGREAELMLLKTEWQACSSDAEARALLLTAAPGMGKSRLKQEFLHELGASRKACTLLLGQGDPFLAGAPFEILRGALLRLCGLHGSEPPEVMQRDLRRRLTAHLPPADHDRVSQFLSVLCRCPLTDEGSPLLQAARQDPKIMRAELGRAIEDWLRAESAVSPILIVLDDLQWGDAATVEILDGVLRLPIPLLLLGFARPGLEDRFPNLWMGQRIHRLPLRELSRRACERLIRHALGSTVSSEAVGRAIEQTAGNALYLEEMIRALAANRSDDRPETILAMMQARIGWLDPSLRRIIRAAAIYGMTFWSGALASLLEQPSDDAVISARLMDLVAREFIVVQRSSRYLGEREYRFRHPLVWEAAYSLLTDDDLRLGHLRASEYLEGLGEQDTMVLAEHLRLGGQPARAVPHYVTAAIQAYERSDLAESLRRSELGISAGAAGEHLGTLQAIRSQAATWRGNLAGATEAGLAALDLLPPGDRFWCAAIGHLLIVVAQTAPTTQFVELVQRFSAVEPRPEATPAYADAASWLVTMFSLTGVHAVADDVLQRLQRTRSKSSIALPADAYIDALTLAGEMYFVRAFGADPYRAAQLGYQATRLLAETGNRHAMLSATLGLSSAVAELGDLETAGALITHQLTQDKTLAGASFLGFALRTYRACALSHSPTAQTQVLSDVEDVLREAFSPAFCGMALTARARIQLAHADYAAAEEDARRGAEQSQTFPPYALESQAVRIAALLGLGQADEARRLAESALTTFLALPHLAYGEVELFYQVGRAREATADLSAAQAAYQRARAALLLRAERIPDTAARTRYLSRFPHHAFLHSQLPPAPTSIARA